MIGSDPLRNPATTQSVKPARDAAAARRLKLIETG
jgi:hypothetical protein